MQNLSLANHKQSQMYFTDLILYNQIVSSFSCSVRTKIAKFKITCTILPVRTGKNGKLKNHPYNSLCSTGKIAKFENNRTLRSNSIDKIGSIEIALAFVDNVHEVIPQLFQ